MTIERHQLPGPADVGLPMVRVLGPITVGTASLSVRGRQVALLGVLALAAPSPQSSGALLEAVFADRADATPGELRVLVSRLRRLLADACPDAQILHGQGGYALVGAEVDATAFERLSDRAAAAEPRDPHDAALAATEALQLWRDHAGLPKPVLHEYHPTTPTKPGETSEPIAGPYR